VVGSTTGAGNTFVGANVAFNNSTGGSNTFIGNNAGSTNSTGSNNTVLGAGANVSTNNLTFATAVGAGAVVDASNRITLGRSNGSDTVRVPGSIFVSGALYGGPDASLGKTTVSGELQVKVLVAGSTPLCASNIGVNMTIGICSQNVAGGNNAAESVKSETVSPALADSLKQQQTQIDEQKAENQKLQEQVKAQQAQLDALKALICAQNPGAGVCQPQEK
jgi:hypothetical protein